MQFKALALLSALAIVGSAQDIDNNDVPQVCRSVCQTTVDLTTQCDRQNDDDDSGYINCVCSTSNASSFIPECEACVAANDEADNDVRDIVRSCSFTQVSTWNSATTGTATSGSSSASITPVNSVTAVTTDSSGSVATITSTGTATSASTQATVTVVAGSGSSSQSTGAAAPAATAGLGGLAVAIMAGVPALL